MDLFNNKDRKYSDQFTKQQWDKASASEKADMKRWEDERLSHNLQMESVEQQNRIKEHEKARRFMNLSEQQTLDLKELDIKREKKVLKSYSENVENIMLGMTLYRKPGVQDLYVMPVTLTETPEERTARERLMHDKNNNLMTVLDHKLLTKFKDGHASYNALLNQAIEDIREEIGDRANEVRELAENKDLKYWMGDDAEENIRILKAYSGDKDKQEEFISDCIAEVLSYDISEQMTDLEWLYHNTGAFIRMYNRILSLHSMLTSARNLNYSFSDDTRNLILCREKQMYSLINTIESNMAQRGIQARLGHGEYEILSTMGGEFGKQRIKEREKEKKGHTIYAALRKEEAKLSVNLTGNKLADMSADVLRFEDFAAMVGSKNRGQVELRNGKLVIINNGKFCSKKGTENQDNLMVKRRFMTVIMERLNLKDADYYKPKLAAMLHLYDPDQTTSMPLTRDTIAKVITEVGLMTSKTNKLIKAGMQANNAQQNAPENQAPHPHVVIARKVDELLPGLIGGVPASRNERSLYSALLNRIVRAGRKHGIRTATLTTHQLDNILNGNLNTLRDNILEDLLTMDNTILNINGGANADPANYITMDLLNKVAALEIARMVDATMDRPSTASQQLSELIYNSSFESAGKNELKEMIDNTYITELSQKGDDGLTEFLSTIKANIPDYDSREVRDEILEFSMFCDRLYRMSEMTETGLAKRNSDYEPKESEMRDLGRRIDETLSKANPFSHILPHLEGTRFHRGFTVARNRYDNGVRFADEAGVIAQNLKKTRMLRQDIPDDAVNEPLRLKLTEAEEREYDRLSGASRKIAEILLMRKAPSDLIEAPEDDSAKALYYLRNMLRDYKSGTPFYINVPLGDGSVSLEQKPGGVLYFVHDGRSVLLPYTAERFADYLDSDIASHVNLYGFERVREIFGHGDFKDNRGRADQGEFTRRRDLCIKALSDLTGKPVYFWSNCDTFELCEFLDSLLLADEADLENVKAGIYEEVHKTDNNGTLNDHETLRYLVQNAAENLVNVEQTITIVPAEKDKVRNVNDGPAWTQEEESVKNLIADMVQSTDTWIGDYEKEIRSELAPHRGYRIEAALKANARAVFLIMQDKTILDRTMEKMAFPDVQTGEEQGQQKSFKQAIRDEVNLILNSKEINDIMALKEQGRNDEFLQQVFFTLLENKRKDGVLEDIEKRIDKHTQSVTASVQSEISRMADKLFGGQDHHEEVNNLPDPYAKNLTIEERQRRINLRIDELKKRMENEYQSGQGQGRFMNTVMKEYFNGVSDIEKRIMVASMLRGSVVKRDTAGMTQQEKKAEEARIAGNNLAGFFKGAGPLFQKMLQGLPEQGMPEAMRIALADMKSNLPQIPADVVRQRMEYLVKRSKGVVTHITVEKSLGAASVGQAFLCRLHGPNLPEEGKEVVVKLLRPEARNRMEREKRVLLDSALHADPTGALRSTYEKQFEKIGEELDLSIEEQNARTGHIYNYGDRSVKSVGVENLLGATGNTIVLEKAPGTTVDRYMKDIEQTRKSAMQGLYRKDEQGNVIYDQESKRPILHAPQEKISDITRARMTLEKELATLTKRQAHIAKAARKWIEESIYGSGFYHGDLHAGNIMIDDNSATIIDYGNAVKLTPRQQVLVTQLAASASVGKADDFIEAFHSLLEGVPEETWEEKKPQFSAAVRSIFAVGAKEASGQMIALSLMRAQALGLKVPASITGLSQSQIRIQNTVDSINATIYAIRRDLEELSTLDGGPVFFDVALMASEKARHDNISEAEAIKAVKKQIRPDMAGMLRDLRKTGRRDVSAFTAKYITVLPQNNEYTERFEQEVSNLRLAQRSKNAANIRTCERQVCEAYEAAFREHRNASEPGQSLRSHLRSASPETKAKVERELEPYFAADTTGELRDTYDAYRRAKADERYADEAEDLERMLLDKYYDLAYERLTSMEDSKEVASREVKSFFDVMGNVVGDHMSASIDRLSFFKSIGYKRELERRTFAVNAAPQRAVQTEDLSDADKAMLADAKQAEYEVPEDEQPQALRDVKRDRNFTSEIQGRITELKSGAEAAAAEYAVYAENVSRRRQTNQEKEQIAAITYKSVWTDIVNTYVNGKEWLREDQRAAVENGGQVPVLKAFIDRFTAAMNADITRMESGANDLEKLSMEAQMHKLFVEMPGNNGGEEFFIRLMKGEANAGGALAGLNLLGQMIGDQPSEVITAMNSMAGDNSPEADQARLICARLLVIHGHRFEKSYRLHANKLSDLKAAALRDKVIADEANANRFKTKRDYFSWLAKSKQKPTLKQEYTGEQGEAAFVAKMKENGWNEAGAEDVFRGIYRIVMLQQPVFTQGQREFDHDFETRKENAVADIGKMKMLFADLTDTKTDMYDRKKNILGVIRSFTKETGANKSKQNKYKNIFDEAEAGSLLEKIENLGYSMGSKADYYRRKTGMSEERIGRRHHERDDLVHDARIGGWSRTEAETLGQLFEMLEKAYEVSVHSADENEKNTAKALAESLDKITRGIKTKPVTNEAVRQTHLGSILDMFGEKETLYGVKKSDFSTMAERELNDEDRERIAKCAENEEKKAQEKIEKERKEKERKEKEKAAAKKKSGKKGTAKKSGDKKKKKSTVKKDEDKKIEDKKASEAKKEEDKKESAVKKDEDKKEEQ